MLSEERAKGVARFGREDHAIREEAVARGIGGGAVLASGVLGSGRSWRAKIACVLRNS